MLVVSAIGTEWEKFSRMQKEPGELDWFYWNYLELKYSNKISFLKLEWRSLLLYNKLYIENTFFKFSGSNCLKIKIEKSAENYT